MIDSLLMKELKENKSVVFENPSYEGALIGISSDGRAIYDYNKMIESLQNEDNMTYEDAVDFISYNTIRSLDYTEDPPIVAYLA